MSMTAHDIPYLVLGAILSVPVYLLMCGFLLVFG